jgi:6-phosphogluconolactonase
MMARIVVHETISALEEAAAGFIALRVHSSIQDRGRSVLSFSGGDTPRGVYRCLASTAYSGRIDWSRVHVCFGDERLVPPDDPQSNFGMVNTELLSRVPIPGHHVHRIRGEDVAEDAARSYAEELRSLLDGWTGRFDLVLLGLGTDGHIASLFPGTGVPYEGDEMVRAVYVPRLESWRVTMTYPLLNDARDVLFLVAGKQKAAIVQRVLGAPEPLPGLPATMIQPANGHVLWMLDAAAASLRDESPPVS